MSLPRGYKRLEYIKSSGTQYINTGFKPNQDTRVTMDFNLLEIVNQYADPIFGVRTSASSKGFYFWSSGYGTTTEQYQSGYNNRSTYPQVTRLGRHYVDKNKNITTIDGISTSATYTAFTTDWNMLLFNSYNNGNLYQNSKLKLYSCQIYDNGTLVRDFVPCINASGAVGLYDLVGKQFYANAGTGTFTAGPVIAISVALSDTRELEYIESSGTQYVNTGFKPNNNSRVVLDFEPTVAYSSIVGIFGIRDANSGTAANMFVFWNNGASTFRTDYFGTQKTMTIPTLLARQTVDKDKNVTTIGSVSVSNTVSTGQCSNNLYLFCTNNVGTAQYFAKLKLYSCQIYDNGTIIRDYIPAKLSDGTVGLYDKLNGLLYINAGTGTFISGYTSLETGDVLNYPYTGAVQSVTLPKGVYKLEVWGAQGGNANATYAFGGRGGYASGIITLNQKEEVFIYVGQSGPVPSAVGISKPAFNGGGYGNTNSTTTTFRVASGGGASDIRIGTDSLFARVIVAGAGGGSAYAGGYQYANGGVGGGETGGNGKPYSTYTYQGYGGTQTEGGKNAYNTSANYGSFGQGGNDVTASYAGAGGGGGWYGGGASDGYYCGGGGGSGFVWTGSNAPSGYLLGSEYYLTDASTIAGNASMPSISGGTETGHTGNGYARITAIKVDSLNLPVNIGGTWKDANEAFVNIGGTWKTVEAAFVNIGGTWKELG